MRFAIAIHPKVIMTWAVVGLASHLIKIRLSKPLAEPLNEDVPKAPEFGAAA